MMKSEDLIKKEENVNAITHGIGVLVAVACLVLLDIFSKKNGTHLQTVCYNVFGISMIMLYLASTIYHSIRNTDKKKRFNKVDHSMIYILIAGTYTPLTLTVLGSTFGWVIFGIIWFLALFGVIYKVFFYTGEKVERTISAILYILMGWLIVIAIVPLIHCALPSTLWLLLAGGLSYTIGVIFYLWNNMPYAHGIFHLFILGGSICHFFSFLVTVI